MSPDAFEATLRLAVFLAVFLTMALWELVAPYRELAASKPRRWRRNLALVAIDTVAVRVVLPAGAVGVAVLAREQGWGLLQLVGWPRWLEIALAFAFLDLVIYLQHVMFHAVPSLWRLHILHHSDVDLDVTTGNRFHPVEILLSMVIKALAVTAVGAPVAAVLAFEIVLNATSMFNHGNVHIPAPLERVLRWVVVTPDMHRVHHSTELAESNSNFGFNLPWWDRLMGTYRAEPAAGDLGMQIGVRHLRDPDRQTLPWMLKLPVSEDVSPAPRRESGHRDPRPG